MSDLFKKLNLKDQRSIVVLDAPREFEAALTALAGVEIHRSLAHAVGATFIIGFVTTLDQVAAYAKACAELTSGDVIAWAAYPKSSSKRYACEFNRDTGWTALGQAGFEPVRQVAIDADWSALRFRRVEHIKSLTRNATMALSDAGKLRAKRAKAS